jgi:hypothetical protein
VYKHGEGPTKLMRPNTFCSHPQCLFPQIWQPCRPQLLRRFHPLEPLFLVFFLLLHRYLMTKTTRKNQRNQNLKTRKKPLQSQMRGRQPCSPSRRRRCATAMGIYFLRHTFFLCWQVSDDLRFSRKRGRNSSRSVISVPTVGTAITGRGRNQTQILLQRSPKFGILHLAKL